MKGGERFKEFNPFYNTKLGTLYNGDCIEVMEYLISKGIKVDAVITDPPYATTNFSWDQIIPYDVMWEKLSKLVKDSGAIVLFGNEPFSSSLRVSNKEYYRYDWKWLKTQVTGFQNSKYQPLRCYEDIMVFSKGSCIPQALIQMNYFPQHLVPVNISVTRSKVNYLRENKDLEKVKQIQEFTNYPRNVIQFARETTLYHPTQKPINLMEYLILTYTKENELVLDFTSGSGSTLIACEVLNRKWIGIELSEKYCNVIKKRISNGIQKKLIFETNKEECL